MTIRKASPEETQQILNYALDVMQEATLGHVEPNWEKANQLFAPFLDNGGYYLIHTDNQKIQGWIGISHFYDIYSNQTVGFLTELYVFSPFRKQGIAKSLCEAAIIQLKQEGCRKVQLNVFAGNRAKLLYEKLDFHEVSTIMERDLN
ncbi:GNAT family N-acetyltransferase [Oceanobacillus halophilus]|uniref:GNAT family N-acetyltransferase n=1 Tax=Oceanobacillus halophilus TaxID=930130 RepID=A0A495A5F7_9BACI|nr:GNAT family N-acetyltransferase [Oceanobacillus halophilus]RKQ34743.1 GNAT family N-acetyltransferase [Oceanobacillus halophilus]